MKNKFSQFNAILAQIAQIQRKIAHFGAKKLIFLQKTLIIASKHPEIIDDIQYFNRQCSKILRFSKRYYLLSNGMVQWCELPNHEEPRPRFYILVGLLSKHGIYNTYYSHINSDSFRKIVEDWDQRRKR